MPNKTETHVYILCLYANDTVQVLDVQILT